MRNLFLLILLFLAGISVGYVLFSSPSSRSRRVMGMAIQNSANSATPSSVVSNTFSIAFTGDVMLGRSVNTRIQKYKDPNWPFLKVSDILKSSDLTLINLESPFMSDCKSTDTGMIFCAHPLSVAGLKFAGIDIANLANNHIDNQGQEGIEETISILKSVDIAPIGLGEAFYKTVKGTKVAFLGFTDVGPNRPGIASAEESKIREQISTAKEQADIIITTFHWGNEYSTQSARQKELAHFTIDAGADAVIGHHPHWIQDNETYQGKPIYYSLGNLVFDQMWSEETRSGLVVKLTFSGKDLIKEEKLPIKIFDYGQPSPVEN